MKGANPSDPPDHSARGAVVATASQDMPAALEKAEVNAWIKEYLLRECKNIQGPIEDHASLDYLGLDSLARVNLVVAVEGRFNLSLDPTAAYDFVTVGAITEYVWSQITGQPLDEKTLLDI
jgi:acyl carrier protein